MMLKTVLIDDERPALKALEYLLKQIPTIEIIGAFTDVDQAMQQIRNDPIDLLFLDIDMPKQNGIATAKKVLAENSAIHIVFVTAYSQFAVEAFEVNATDYIMKPVSKKRLDKTLERITQKHLPLDSSVIRQKQTDFLNHVLNEEITVSEEIVSQANLLDIDFTQSFSVFFLLLSHANSQLLQEESDEKKLAMDAFLDELSTEAGLLPWKTPQGISILDFSIIHSEDYRTDELAKAAHLKSIAASHFPNAVVALGIAKRYTKIENFVDRYVQARNAVLIGIHASPDLGIYHFLDSGFLPILDHYVDKQNVNKLIANTIGKTLDYDKANGTELFRTMEAIILHNNLQDVATTLFIHYKTVLFRKQSIEKVLGIEMNSFAGRTMLGVALTLYYLQSIPSIQSSKE
jgi:DNA-binding NarL/FixJ family response regulator